MRASTSALPIKSGQVVGLDFDQQGECLETVLHGKEYRKRIGFVRQQDYLVDYLTVRETLYFVSLRWVSTFAAKILPRSENTPDL